MRDLEFQTTDWPEITLGDVCTFRGGSGFRESHQGHTSGDHPFIKVSDLTINGNEKYITTAQNWVSNAALRELRATLQPQGAVVFAKVGAALKLNRRRILGRPTAIDNNMMAAIPNEQQLDGEFLYYFLLIQDLGRFSQESAVPSVNQGHLSSIEISLPPLPEQRKIAEILRTWDKALEKLTALRVAKAQRLDGLAARLIHDEQAERLHLRDFLSEVSTRNHGQQVERVLSVTNSAGFVLAEDQFAHRVASADLSNYKIVRRGQYAYNPSRINVGSIARLDAWEDGALSPMYVVFRVRNGLDSDFFRHWLRSAEARQRIALAAQGSVRETVSFGDLGSILIPVPTIERQQSISRALNAGREEIALIEAEIEALTRQKRGLMQKLLTGEWRVSP